MTILESARQTVASMSYQWYRPATYLVFVPGLSLLIQKIQMRAMLPLMPANFSLQKQNQELIRTADSQARKFITVCKWHLVGSLLQILMVRRTAMKIQRFRLPILVMGAIATFELLDTAYKAFKIRVTIFDFDKDKHLTGVTYNTTIFNLLYTSLLMKQIALTRKKIFGVPCFPSCIRGKSFLPPLS